MGLAEYIFTYSIIYLEIRPSYFGRGFSGRFTDKSAVITHWIFILAACVRRYVLALSTKLRAISCSRATLYYRKVIYKQLFHQKFNRPYNIFDLIEFKSSVIRTSSSNDGFEPCMKWFDCVGSKKYRIRIDHHYNNLQVKNRQHDFEDVLLLLMEHNWQVICGT